MMDTLPLELVLMILSHCDIPTGVALGMTCHYLFSCCLVGRFNMRVTFAGASLLHLWRNSRWDVIYDLIVYRGLTVPKTLFLDIAHTQFRLDHFVNLMRHLGRDKVAGLYDGVTDLHQVIERCDNEVFDKISFFHLVRFGYYRGTAMDYATNNRLMEVIMVLTWLNGDTNGACQLANDHFETFPIFRELADQDLVRKTFHEEKQFYDTTKLDLFMCLTDPTRGDVLEVVQILSENSDTEDYFCDLAERDENRDVLVKASTISVYVACIFNFFAGPYRAFEPGYLHDACYIDQVRNHDPDDPDYIKPEFTVRILMEDDIISATDLRQRGAQWFRGASSCAEVFYQLRDSEQEADPVDILVNLFVGATDEFKRGACLVCMTYKWPPDIVSIIAHMVPVCEINMAIDYCEGQGFDDYVSLLRGRLDTL